MVRSIKIPPKTERILAQSVLSGDWVSFHVKVVLKKLFLHFQGLIELSFIFYQDPSREFEMRWSQKRWTFGRKTAGFIDYSFIERRRHIASPNCREKNDSNDYNCPQNAIHGINDEPGRWDQAVSIIHLKADFQILIILALVVLCKLISLDFLSLQLTYKRAFLSFGVRNNDWCRMARVV